MPLKNILIITDSRGRGIGQYLKRETPENYKYKTVFLPGASLERVAVEVFQQYDRQQYDNCIVWHHKYLFNPLLYVMPDL